MSEREREHGWKSIREMRERSKENILVTEGEREREVRRDRTQERRNREEMIQRTHTTDESLLIERVFERRVYYSKTTCRQLCLR